MKCLNVAWGVLLGLALPGVAAAQTQSTVQALLSIQRAPTGPKWQAGMAEDVEVLRRLLAQKLGHGRSANGLILWDADGGGNNISSHVVPAISGVNVNELLIRMSLGEKVGSLNSCANASVFVGLCYFNFESGAVRTVCGVETVRALPGVLDVFISVRPGQQLEPASDGPSRHGHFIATAASAGELQSLCERIYDEVRVAYA